MTYILRTVKFRDGKYVPVPMIARARNWLVSHASVRQITQCVDDARYRRKDLLNQAGGIGRRSRGLRVVGSDWKRLRRW